jgi:hypothetical protein
MPLFLNRKSVAGVKQGFDIHLSPFTFIPILSSATIVTFTVEVSKL